MNNSLERWKSGDQRLQVVVEGFSETDRKYVIDLFEQLGWGHDNLPPFAKMLTNTYLGKEKTTYELLHGSSIDHYPVTSVVELHEIVDYEYSKKDEKGRVSETNTFTKDDLISGDHIVELRNGERYLVAGDLLISSTWSTNKDAFNSDLIYKYREKELDVMKVFNGRPCGKYYCPSAGIDEYLHSKNLVLVWERKSAKEILLEKDIESLKKELKRKHNQLDLLRGS